MKRWLDYLKSGLSHRASPDRFRRQGVPERTLRDRFRRFGPYLSRFRNRLIIGAGIIFLAAIVSFPLPLVSRYLIDDVIMARRLSLLAITVLAIVGLGAAGRLISLYQQYYFDVLDRQIVLGIQSDLIERVLHFPKSFFDRVQTGYLVNRLESDVEGMGWFFSSAMIGLLENIVRFAGGICFLLYLDWRLTVALIVLLPGLIWLVRYFSDRLRYLTHANMEVQASLSGQFQETLSSTTLIKAFAAEDKMLDRLTAALRNAMRLSIEQGTVSALAHTAIDAMPAVTRAGVLFLGAYWVITGHWSLGSLFAYQAYLGYVFGPARVLATANLQMQTALASVDRVANLYDIIPEQEVGEGKPVEKLEGDIAFRDVSFAYDPDRPILEHVTFSIRAGECAAIAGVSGVGKTTLVSLLLRFYRPTEGEIHYDGRPAGDYDLTSLRQRLGYVPQQHMLLSGSIAENIAYGNAGASDEEIARAAGTAGIHDFIAGLPEGYRTQIGERGILFSEGQKQRLSIARALLKRPDVILLDEPAAALDGQAAQALLSSLGPALAGRTVIVISNDEEWLKACDRVLYLEDRRLSAIGAHAELMVSKEAYAALVRGAP
mgnify:CR=1 FL=1